MLKKTQEKLDRIQELLQKKNDIETELDTLLSPEKEVVLPVGFSMNNEVLEIVREAGDRGIDAKGVLIEARKKHPTYSIDRKKTASALTYLKNSKKSIVQIGRGLYKVASTANTSTVESG